MLSPVWSYKTPFTPKKQETGSVGRTSVSLYPKIDGLWSDAEKAMVYQQIRTALATTNLDQRTWILTLADRLDLMTSAKSNLADWERRLNGHWADFAHLTILSWHNTAGTPINDTTMEDDPSILKPVQNSATEDSKSVPIWYHVPLWYHS